MKKVKIAKDAETIVLDERVKMDWSHLKGKGNKRRLANSNERAEKAFYEKRCKTDKANSYATEATLKANYERDMKNASPGLKEEVRRKYRNEGRPLVRVQDRDFVRKYW